MSNFSSPNLSVFEIAKVNILDNNNEKLANFYAPNILTVQVICVTLLTCMVHHSQETQVDLNSNLCHHDHLIVSIHQSTYVGVPNLAVYFFSFYLSSKAFISGGVSKSRAMNVSFSPWHSSSCVLLEVHTILRVMRVPWRSSRVEPCRSHCQTWEREISAVAESSTFPFQM